jgi:hypothetical protein
MSSTRILAALGLALGTASASLQSIGIAADHYQMTIQVIAVICTVVGVFLQSVTRPIVGDKSDQPPGPQ